MRVFLTGATGYIGSAVLEALLRNGHEVTALVRTPGKAEAITYGAARPMIGNLSKPDSYALVAAECDAIIHTAYEQSKNGQAIDQLALETLIEAARRRAEGGQPAAMIYTSNIWILGNTQTPASEEDEVDPPEIMRWRRDHEQRVLDAAGAGLRTIVLRPGIVYGGARGVIGDFLRDAQNGLVRVVGSGQNHWPCVYDRDVADLYVRLIAHPDASGIFHANDEADEAVDEIVDAIARHAKMRPDVRHMPLSEARTKLGPVADALALDQRVRSARARALGWSPSLHSVGGNVARLLEEFRAAREAA